MTMNVTFPGGMAVDATFRGHTVHTDQPVAAGGGGTAMAPFDLFLASIATCMGFYALRFCQERQLPTEGLALTLDSVRDPEKKMLSRISVAVQLPEGFPEKYREAIHRAVDLCAVKKHIFDPPAFDITLTEAAVAAR